MDIIAFFPNPELDYNPPVASTESLILTIIGILIAMVGFYFARRKKNP